MKSFFFCDRNGGGGVIFIFILPKIEHTKVITFFPLPCLIFQTGEAEGISLMVLEINETVFGTETCKSGEAAGEQTDPKVDMQIANHPCRILPLLYYCCDRQHCVQGVSYQTGICNLGWCVGMGCIVTTALAPGWPG